MQMESKKLFLIRHGQTNLNRDLRFRGFTDAPLNEDGRLEAAGAALLLENSGIKTLFSSPMPRAVETASIIARDIGCSVKVDESFIDVDYGDWQGLTVEDVINKYGRSTLESWKKEPDNFKFPGGDSVTGVHDRLAPALIDAAESQEDGNVGIVSHLLILKLCFLVALDLSYDWFWRITLDNGSVGIFQYEPGEGFILESWNCLPSRSEVIRLQQENRA